MKLCRFNDQRFGLVIDNSVRDVTHVLERLPAYRYPLATHDPLIAHLSELRPILLAEAHKAEALAISDVAFLSPIANAGKVVAAPVNYKAHLDEAREDAAIHFHNKVVEIQTIGLFLKATSSIVGPSEGVHIRFADRRNDHEIELAVIIGAKADRVSPQKAMNYVAGYCIGLDMTVRGPQERSLRKSLDHFTVLGPWMVSADEMVHADAADMELCVNGAQRQKANTRDLLIGIPELIAWASSYYTLHPGDVLMTGTPEGVGPVVAGDVITATIAGIGEMKVEVTSLRDETKL
jgi:2-keto-4-pentenoate hydratase/2-oxohepta-3-ene-1,7-dioic acid hydratase in catechol pathway